MKLPHSTPARIRSASALSLCLVLLAVSSLRGDDLVVTENITLDPAKAYGRMVIKASNVTIDGKGAWLIGAKEGNPKGFKGTAVFAEGVSHVALKNVNAKGWEIGLNVKNGNGWTIENCNFSDNFHDPKFGWGENGRRGGIVLERVTESKLHKNKANRVWDGCVLVGCDKNSLIENDFSRTSNTCIKLWNSSGNFIKKNNLSYGLRIDPGEVHARDSTCVLIESGSDGNRLTGNDCTHGGDGIFVRVLNQWVSTANVFDGNDCSYANNNCVEAWSPGNMWIRNKANHGSYGFWLGASDKNTLIENEASYNGLADGFHNSPHLPDKGHAGIVFMFGPSSHTVLRKNVCVGNNGAGIAAIGDLDSKGKKWNAFHWIVEENTLRQNRWGIYLQHAQMIDLAANRFEKNTAEDVWLAENVTEVVRREGPAENRQAPEAKLVGPDVAKVGQPVSFTGAYTRDPEGNASKLGFRWRIAPDVSGTDRVLNHTFTAPGFYRIALTVNNDLLSDLAWRDLYVIEDLRELGTEGNAENWSWIDDGSKVKFAVDTKTKLMGESSLRANISPYSGGRVTLRFTVPGGGVSLGGKKHLVFWLKTRNENVPAWQDLNPLVSLGGADGKKLALTPARDFLSAPPYNEAREGWTYFSIPLAGDADWKRSGDDLTAAQSLHFGFDSWGAPPLMIWLDGVALK